MAREYGYTRSMAQGQKLSSIRVTTRDMRDEGEEIESHEYVPEDSFIIVTAGRMEVSHIQRYRSGTVQLTLKLVG